MLRAKAVFFLLAAILVTAEAAHSQQSPFHLQEGTIDEVHRAIRNGQITCRGLVELYINRAKAYNGVSNVFVTKGRSADSAGSWNNSRRLATQIS
jgi:amidase